MTPEQVVDLFGRLIGTVGFPIFVCVWYMLVQNKESKYMTTAINELTKAITTMCAKLDVEPPNTPSEE